MNCKTAKVGEGINAGWDEVMLGVLSEFYDTKGTFFSTPKTYNVYLYQANIQDIRA